MAPASSNERHDGSRARYRTKVQERSVVTVFLRRIDTGQVLIARRSSAVSTYRGRWAGISGTIESDPAGQALTELREETGLTEHEARCVKAGNPIRIEDTALGVAWTVHPFLFETDVADRVRHDWEHTEFRWVRPEDVGVLETVPGLVAALRAVLL
jgi:8-oxo-dGTP pyrophosphatase MutT (NUDIX family)